MHVEARAHVTSSGPDNEAAGFVGFGANGCGVTRAPLRTYAAASDRDFSSPTPTGSHRHLASRLVNIASGTPVVRSKYHHQPRRGPYGTEI